MTLVLNQPLLGLCGLLRKGLLALRKVCAMVNLVDDLSYTKITFLYIEKSFYSLWFD